ncbi:DNA polymerase zeta catalytic subunit [Dirofilaria immitis]
MLNVTCDYYMEKPNGFNKPHLRTNVKVPIIRMFGILETGQKCCVHVHGVFPYIIIRTGVQFTPEFASVLHNKINAIVSHYNPRYKFNADFAIYQIKPITARSLYGYHKDNENFVQILCYNPLQLRIIANALQREVRKNSIFQVYESHVPYILQFFVDHSIFGMDLVNFSSVQFRISPQRNFNDFYYQDLKVENIVNNVKLVSPLLPSTTVAIECDVFAANISNTSLYSTSEMFCNPGLNYIWQDEQRRYRKRGEELVSKLSQTERASIDTEKERNYFCRLHTFFKSIAPTTSFGATQNDAFHIRNDSEKVGKNDALEYDFDTTRIGIFDDELFLDVEDEMNEIIEGNEQEFQEDFDLKEKVGTVCEAVESGDGPTSNSVHSKIFQSKLQHLDPNFIEEFSDESISNDNVSDDEIVSNTSGIENLLQVRKSSKESSQQSNNSNDLFENYPENIKNPDTSWTNSGCPEENLRNWKESSQYSCLSFSSKASQIPASSKSFRSRGSDELSQWSNNWTEDEEVINCARSYEIDIESTWIPKGQKFIILDDLEPVFSKNEQWLRPVKRLPFRRKINQISDIEQSFTTDNGELIENMSQPRKKVVAEQFFTESLTENSFINYENTKEKLEQSIVAPSVTPQTSEAKQVDIHHLCVMSMEILALSSRGMPVPDPQHNQILGIFYTISTDFCMQDEINNVSGVLLNMNDALVGENELYTFVASEIDLLDEFVNIVRRYDPDIVIGYNAQRYSWGYLTERSLVIGRNLLSEISRVPIEINDYYRPGQEKKSSWIKELDPTPRGRILINVWRFLRHEIALRNYTISNVVNSVLKRRFPHYDFSTLSDWILSGKKDLIILVLKHMQLYCELNLQILSRLNFFTKTSEMARLYGIQFNEVLTRGSQFRVESMLLRLARREKYVAPSISPAQRGAMCSPETLPLTMEPESGFYRDPVIVLDFQSLYPSIIIAYNYCFTTCFGKVSHIENICSANKIIEFGGLEYNCPIDDIVSMLTANKLHISPTGAIFCQKTVRRGLMPVMLEEILNTRVMVKKAAENYKKDRHLSRILDARQMALKLIANVTYGYAAANFSGRMPCVEVADAIVSKGREVLERAIKLVDEGTYGSSRVIYGDTDSMFVVCPGVSRTEAFDIGKKIADDVTRTNPSPIKLKLEKIMHPLILESKKRYVGMSYENINDIEGIFDAKGIETVRRDSCPLVSKILEKALRLLFTNDINGMVRYLDMQLSNLSKLPLSDFIFSREYRKSYAESAVVASKLIAEKRKAVCPRYEPEVGERVPRRLKINFEYYVKRQLLPSLHRALDFVPLKIEWHCPTIVGCYNCKALGARLWCNECITDPKALLLAVCDYHRERRLLAKLNDKCRDCLSLRSINIDYNKCINMACIVKQKRISLDCSVAELAIRSHFLTENKPL